MSHDFSSSRQLAAILFTDIVGYTGMMQTDEHKTLALVKHYNAVLEREVTHHHGQVVNYYGDGSLCIFKSATEALHCAMAIQVEFRKEPAVPLRIGLHVGEVIFEDGKVLGDGVNIASRIQSLGQQNTILFSAEVHDKIKNNLSFSSHSLGQFDFKNVRKPMEVFALANEGLLIPQRKKITGKLEPRSARKRNVWIGTLLLVVLIAGIFLKQQLSPLIDSGAIEKSIAVLPFTDMSEKGDQEFFSDGLTEDIITQLAKIKAFRVTSRTSVMQYKRNTKPIREIARELGTAHILEGSVQRSGQKVRITAQLINCRTDEHLWAETYDRAIDDIFSIQSDISTKIANALKATLSSEEKESLEKKYTDNTEAYQLYLQGRYYWNQRLEEPVNKAITFFKQAIALDSTYALAYAGLGDAYLMLGVYSVLRPDTSFPQARQFAEKALQLDPTLAEAYATLVDIHIHFSWDMAAAEASFQKAIALNPNYANAYHWHAEVYDIQGDFDNAIAESRKALDLDPYNLIINTQLGKNLVYAGDMAGAVKQLQKTLEFDSAYSIAQYNIGVAYLGLKQIDKARSHFLRATQLAPGNARNQAALGFAEATLGRKNEAKQIRDFLLQESKNKFVPSYDLAVICLGLGDQEKAMYYLEQAYKNREPWMPFIGMNPLFTSLFSHPQFKDLVTRIRKG